MRTSHKMMFGLVICALAAMWAWGGLNWQAWVQSWIGVTFKAVWGGSLAYLAVRFGFGLDLSKTPDPLVRAVQGLGLLIFCGIIAHAIATGA